MSVASGVFVLLALLVQVMTALSLEDSAVRPKLRSLQPSTTSHADCQFYSTAAAQCFLVEFSAAIGATWGTRQVDRRLAEQLSATALQPLGLAEVAANFICRSSHRLVPMVAFPNPVPKANDINALMTDVRTQCQQGNSGGGEGVQSVDEVNDNVQAERLVAAANNRVSPFTNSEQFLGQIVLPLIRQILSEPTNQARTATTDDAAAIGADVEQLLSTLSATRPFFARVEETANSLLAAPLGPAASPRSAAATFCADMKGVDRECFVRGLASSVASSWGHPNSWEAPLVEGVLLPSHAIDVTARILCRAASELLPEVTGPFLQPLGGPRATLQLALRMCATDSGNNQRTLQLTDDAVQQQKVEEALMEGVAEQPAINNKVPAATAGLPWLKPPTLPAAYNPLAFNPLAFNPLALIPDLTSAAASGQLPNYNPFALIPDLTSAAASGQLRFPTPASLAASLNDLVAGLSPFALFAPPQPIAGAKATCPQYVTQQQAVCFLQEWAGTIGGAWNTTEYDQELVGDITTQVLIPLAATEWVTQTLCLAVDLSFSILIPSILGYVETDIFLENTELTCLVAATDEEEGEGLSRQQDEDGAAKSEEGVVPRQALKQPAVATNQQLVTSSAGGRQPAVATNQQLVMSSAGGRQARPDDLAAYLVSMLVPGSGGWGPAQIFDLGDILFAGGGAATQPRSSSSSSNEFSTATTQVDGVRADGGGGGGETCNFAYMDARCFIIEYATLIGASWNTAEYDRNLARDLVSFVLEPTNSVDATAVMMCSSATQLLPTVSGGVRPIDRAEVGHFLEWVQTQCS
eukprot:GHVS01090978.1.p1 GENE.GHVS01090978.1~~GHVS01090978.1.p1  ORF type:complete len:837 (-),score=182.96 GHVS01090978.1:87-2513(-)